MGRVPSSLQSSDTGKMLLTACANVLLIKIKEAFLTKSRGGTDEAGDRWEPLSPKTIAYSRSARSRVEAGRSSRPSQGLTKTQQERWWDVYRQGLAIYKGNKASAAKRAWFILKGEGARTLFEKYSGGNPEILNKSGNLLESIKIKSIITNFIEVHADSKMCPYALAHHNGVRGRLPRRRLWPPVNRWPASWWDEIMDAAVEMVVGALTKAASSTR